MALPWGQVARIADIVLNCTTQLSRAQVSEVILSNSYAHINLFQLDPEKHNIHKINTRKIFKGFYDVHVQLSFLDHVCL